MNETQLNEKIRNAIKQAGYKQKEVASMLKVTQAAVSEWVTGRSAPRHVSRGVEAPARMVFE